MPTSDAYRTRFLQLALRVEALRFGEFTLKSGRVSPYFFNAGRLDSGAALAEAAACYAEAVEQSGIGFDLLFGPAYKGIPLATALACEFARRGRDVAVAFNRKEAKAHGEGGTLIGASMQGQRVLVVDDVITAGTAIREALDLIAGGGGMAAGVVIALDRQEAVDPATSRRSAAQTVTQEHGLPVIAVARLEDLFALGDDAAFAARRDELSAYRKAYGST